MTLPETAGGQLYFTALLWPNKHCIHRHLSCFLWANKYEWCGIWGFHGGEDSGPVLLDCDNV